MDGLAAELREQDGKLTWKDAELRQWLDNINFGLDAEVTLGQTQDAKLADHESRLGTAEWQLVDKQQQMDDLDANITDTFHKLGHDLEDSADAIRADLGNLTEALEAGDRAIRILDTASNFRLDNLNITIQNNLTKVFISYFKKSLFNIELSGMIFKMRKFCLKIKRWQSRL